jgi:hypothetical protein
LRGHFRSPDCLNARQIDRPSPRVLLPQAKNLPFLANRRLAAIIFALVVKMIGGPEGA